ncbi:MAG TPA: alpha/beta hydrolase [Candidatus Didemnitutus sp.]|nr:alpha/beta hydrolase [Candidatus Didemnitutus sp.]
MIQVTAWFAALLLGYAVLAIAAHFLSLKMIFPRPPVKYELTPDYVKLTTPDGVKLAARYWPNPSAKLTVLYLHGNYEDLGSLGEYLPGFIDAGYAIFAFDYRNYGHSGGTSTEASTYADAQLAYDFVRNTLKVPADRIVLFGYSLGGGPAVELALHQPAAGLVLQGAFVSAYRVMTRLPVVAGDKFLNLRKAPALRLPVMVIHGTADGTVPFWHGPALYAAITSRKAKLFIDGGPHTGLADFTGPRYWEELKKFTDSL